MPRKRMVKVHNVHQPLDIRLVVTPIRRNMVNFFLPIFPSRWFSLENI